jgi:hypothetical protein
MRIFMIFAGISTAATALVLLLASALPAAAVIKHATLCNAPQWVTTGTHGIKCCGGSGSCLVKFCPLTGKWVYTGQRNCIN